MSQHAARLEEIGRITDRTRRIAAELNNLQRGRVFDVSVVDDGLSALRCVPSPLAPDGGVLGAPAAAADIGEWHVKLYARNFPPQSLLVQVRRMRRYRRAQQPSVPSIRGTCSWPAWRQDIAQMAQSGCDHILMGVTFPPLYPLEPPFFRIIRPRFAWRTGARSSGSARAAAALTAVGVLRERAIDAQDT